MKKHLFLICLLVVGTFLIVGNSFAKTEVQSSFLVGKFLLNQANWDKHMESQLLEGLSGLSGNVNVDVFGYTDESGSIPYNEKLAQERADLVAGKIENIKPNFVVSSKGLVYIPSKGQEVNYRMVEVVVSYKKALPTNESGKYLAQVNSSIEVLKTNFDNANKKLMIDLNYNQSATNAKIDSLDETMRYIDGSSKQVDAFMKRLEKKIDLSFLENKNHNGLMQNDLREFLLEQKGVYESNKIIFQKQSANTNNIQYEQKNDVHLLVTKIDSLSDSLYSRSILLLIFTAMNFAVLLVIVFKKNKP